MRVLTFDIEDWYNCDYITRDFDWDKFEFRVDKTLYPMLDELDRRGLKGTFFCLGWLAEKHPEVIKEIDRRGHQVGCHSYQHELVFRFTHEQFIKDTITAKGFIEDVIGKPVEAYRAPGFSITEQNTWTIESLIDLGFKYDCSVFPAYHDCGGMPNFGTAEPVILKTASGKTIKEFPINIHKFLGKNFVFSGGGFFRFFPYWVIRSWGRDADYMMSYFHPRDFDTGQPIVKSLPLKRKFKSYIGIKGNFRKWQKFISDFELHNIAEADSLINWEKQRIVEI